MHYLILKRASVAHSGVLVDVEVRVVAAAPIFEGEWLCAGGFGGVKGAARLYGISYL